MTSKIVILAEKPSQAEDFAKVFTSYQKKQGYIEVTDNDFFGGEVLITWAVGHLLELKDPAHYRSDWGKAWTLESLPIMPKNIEFEVQPERRKQFNIVKRLLRSATEIIIGTDTGREGENIAWSIIHHAGVSGKSIKRLWFNSLQKKELVRAFKALDPGERRYPLYKEAQTRQIADWLVGLNATRLYTLILKQKGIHGVYSVGRVQTPTLFLVYQREQDIKNFKEKPYFELCGTAIKGKDVFTIKVKERFEDKAMIQSVCSKYNLKKENEGVVTLCETEEKNTTAPSLFSLSGIQEYANKKWKYSPIEVKDIVQVLYEKHKILSYPRTDCSFITEHEFQYLKDNIAAYQKIIGDSQTLTNLQPRNKYVNPKKVKDHYAIVPTENIPDQEMMGMLNQKEKNIYDAVLRRTIGMFAADHHYDETQVVVDVNGLNSFETSGKVVKLEGWKALYDDAESDPKKEYQTLPSLNVGDILKVSVFVKEGLTKPPKLLTQGQLINRMTNIGRYVEDENHKKILNSVEGIGTEATRANILADLVNKKKLKIEKNRVTLTPQGLILCEAIQNSLELLSKPEMTAKWEKYLLTIGQGKGKQSVFINNVEKFIEHMLEVVPAKLMNQDFSIPTNEVNYVNQKGEKIVKCPLCKSGDIRDVGKLYGCSNYQNGCKCSFPKEFAGKKLTQNMVKSLATKGETSKLKGFVSKKKKNKFDARLIFKANKIQFSFD
ncbi:DNA topoisomerase III [Bacillus sp. NMCC4]|uniref:type IA DNA topoisomerase n=1 Tax=Bacillus sp. NMCC4 TaxID=2108539 RepID=UPI000D031875|nr:type IA DNA topoisomerase [Bacillus sp. NMCC4]PRS35705.1 DNA topoisomerase III [Bacillus sp. NMCC4]